MKSVTDAFEGDKLDVRNNLTRCLGEDKEQVGWDVVLTCGAKKVYGFDPLIENKVANDDRFVRYNCRPAM